MPTMCMTGLCCFSLKMNEVKCLSHNSKAYVKGVIAYKHKLNLSRATHYLLVLGIYTPY